MTEVFPNYYENFKCIADRCEHTCCKGWEIEIDEDTLDLYQSLEGELADKIRNNIEGETPHFKLSDDERCPFLNESGLCDIITEFGDGAICDICYLHPRFTNFYENFSETGLGFACEEAGRVILSQKEKFYISPVLSVATNEEKEFFKEREKVFKILQQRNKKVSERVKELIAEYDASFCVGNVYDIYKDLERLDENWTKELEKLRNVAFDFRIFEKEEFKLYFEQLFCYFTLRHFTMDYDYKNSVKFIVLSCFVIAFLWHFNNDFEKIVDIARMYSSEIEYSDENVEKIRVCLL